MEILNQIIFSDTLTTSGQPSENEFKQIKKSGVSCVINLATSQSDNAVQNEDIIVTNLDMRYVHIPIPWDSPQIEHFKIFSQTMNTLNREKTWLHCALNMRASCFAYLYTTIVLGMQEKSQQEKMWEIWKPNETWQTLITQIQKLNME